MIWWTNKGTNKETILKYLVFLTASKKKLFLCLDVKSNDTEACHRIGNCQNGSKKTTVCFTNRKIAKQALYNRKKLKSIDKSTFGLTNDVSIKENLSPVNNRIAYNCRILNCQNLISKKYTINGMVHLISNNIKRGKPVMQTLLNLSTDVEFEASNNEEEDVNELANESYQSSY